MAIAPPTDIVLDVLNAADPTALQEAQAKLKAGQAVNEAQRLASTDKSFDAALKMDKTLPTSFKVDRPLDSVNKGAVPESYRKFEGMVLQQFIKSMLPDSEEIYGKGASGEIWKGMMAEQLGNEIARNGGIGIADKLMQGGATKITDKVASADSNRSDRMHMATQLIEENQMKALDKLLPGDHADKAKLKTQ